MRRALAAAAVLALLAAPAAAPAAPAGEDDWGKRLAAAKRFAADRTGKVSIGIVDEDRRFHGYRADRQYSAASTVKVMLMVAYLRHGDRNHESLTDSDRALLGPMITRSDSDAATTIRDIVGNDSLVRLAKRAGMERFTPSPYWDLIQITARDQAGWMYEIQRYIPDRHRDYAMNLLARIIPRQRWGIPPEAPSGYDVRFKGGWMREAGTGWTVNQVARLERRDVSLSLAIMSRGSPSKEYGIATIRGVAHRLLAHYAG